MPLERRKLESKKKFETGYVAKFKRGNPVGVCNYARETAARGSLDGEKKIAKKGS